MTATTFLTVADIKRAAKDAGSYFFAPSTMRFWDSSILPRVYPIDGGAFFITGESDEGTRAYTVRLATVTKDGRFNISPVGDFMGYRTAQAAKKTAIMLSINANNA
jgi:hypothetical protein